MCIATQTQSQLSNVIGKANLESILKYSDNKFADQQIEKSSNQIKYFDEKIHSEKPKHLKMKFSTNKSNGHSTREDCDGFRNEGNLKFLL